MGRVKKNRRPGIQLSPEEGFPAIFKDKRYMLSCGDDVQVIHYRQERLMNKTCFALHQNVISFVIYGQKLVYHVDGRLTVLPMQGFFLKKGNYLGTERSPDVAQGYESIVILLSDGFMQSLSDGISQARTMMLPQALPMEQNNHDRVFHLRQDDLVAGLVDQFLGYFRADQDKSRVEAVLPLKIREMMALLTSSPQNLGFGEFVKSLSFIGENALGHLMETHFKESLSLEQWAFLAGLSLSSFKRKFEAIFHQPPRKWIQSRRLQEAYHLLADGRMNVTEVCYAVGFESPAHFVHAFKTQYHITPKQRQLLAGKVTPNALHERMPHPRQ